MGVARAVEAAGLKIGDVVGVRIDAAHWRAGWVGVVDRPPLGLGPDRMGNPPPAHLVHVKFDRGSAEWLLANLVELVYPND